MQTQHPPFVEAKIALVAGLGMACAMGIGRFAFTPIMPLMQAMNGISDSQSNALAIANYLGYLLGALGFISAGTKISNAQAACLGLAGVCLTTLGMAIDTSVNWLLFLRAVSGVCSAFSLVGLTAWALTSLTTDQRSVWSGLIFSGVGAGISMAGLMVIGVTTFGGNAKSAWLALGFTSGVITVLVCSVARSPASVGVPTISIYRGKQRSHRVLIIAYAMAGFGYIVPATYLPAATLALVPHSTLFAWVWPAFGFTVAVSTYLSARQLSRIPPYKLWIAAQIVMAIGVAIPAFFMHRFSLLICAILVGSSFMSITMAASQEAWLAAEESAPALMAKMTTAFALGQLAGPMLLPKTTSALSAMQTPGLIAAGLLLLPLPWLASNH